MLPEDESSVAYEQIQSTMATLAEFNHLLDSHPDVSTIVLHSRGGSVGFGYGIAVEIRKRGLYTRVERNSVCAGGCLLALLAGKQRSVNIEAEIVWMQLKKDKKAWALPVDMLGDTLAPDVERSRVESIMRRGKPGKPNRLSLDDLLSLKVELYK